MSCANCEPKEFQGVLRVVRLAKLGSGLFKATCTRVDSSGNIVDRNNLYYLMASYSLMGRFVEVSQIWEVLSGVCWIDELTLESGHTRPVVTIEPNKAVMLRPAGKHLVWHLTHTEWYPGIGKSKAVNLIEHLSNEKGHEPLYQALDMGNIEALISVPLITEWDAEVLIKGWVRHGSTDVLKWFENKHIDPTLAQRVFEFHGEKTIEAIEEDPYRLSSFNMPWSKVDALARTIFKIERTDNRRLQAAVTEALWGAFNSEGHTKFPVSEFVTRLEPLIGGDLEELVTANLGMIEQSRAILRNNYIHQFETAVMEMRVVNRIADLLLLDYLAPLSSEEMTVLIKTFELEQGIELTEQQKQAITTSVSNPFSVITGGAGVGKTTVLKALYALYDAAGFKRKQLALSGRAAQRMYEATIEEATTIAGYIYHFDWSRIPPEEQKKTVVVIDEASMVDIHSMYRVVDKTPPNVHLILIGDPFQLPPVGGGLVLHELVERTYLPISELSIVKRQGKDSSIPTVAAEIRQGRVPKDYGENVEFHDVRKDELADRVVKEYVKQPDVSQILCATNKLVAEVNRKAQALLNPDGLEVSYCLEGLKYDTGIRLNDPVICKDNIYRDEYDLRNGSMGRIIEVYDTPRSFDIRQSKKSKQIQTVVTYGRVCWDDGSDDGYTTELPFEVLQSIQLAYGITVHKSQGSQFKHTIFAVVNTANLDRTLVYTAITRARQHCVVMGDIEVVNRAIVELPCASKRCVGLGDFLDEILCCECDIC